VSVLHSRSRRLFQVGAGGVGAFAAGFGAGQSSNADVIFTPVDVDVPATTSKYPVDLNGDSLNEFFIQHYVSVTKVAFDTNMFPSTATTALVLNPNGNRTANLAVGTLIGPTSTFGPNGAPPSGGDPLNGKIDHDQTPGTPNVPAGNFQVSDGPGFIGVRFLIGGNTHYGYVGYEGTGSESDAAGHAYALGYEDVPNTAITAGDGIPFNFPGDSNEDRVVNAADYVVWRKADGGDFGYNTWRSNFGNTLGGETGSGGESAVPEPSSLCLLAVGAVGTALYRCRRSLRESIDRPEQFEIADQYHGCLLPLAPMNTDS
jgi:hypothetical protein